MSKKHFIALADAVRKENQFGDKPFSVEQITTLADFCQSQNSNFNRERWLAYVNGECGPNGGKR
jgi:hypothetical protein